ncbi:MAG: RNA polymerase sigma factor [Candidatus Dormibacteria bacterium]
METHGVTARVVEFPRRSRTDPFEELFLAEYPRIVAVAHRVLGDLDEAEDVAQEVFIDFHHRHPAGAPHATGWLRVAAAHAALNRLRGARRRERREVFDTLREPAATAGADPAQEAERAEARAEVRAALARLPERSAAVLALRYSGLSYQEVAASLQVGVGQVGTMLRRAETALRREVEHGTR